MKRGAETDNEPAKRPRPDGDHTTPVRPAVGGKQPVTPGGVAKPSGIPARPGVSGKQPGMGGKHPPGAGGKQPGMGGKHPPGAGGKQPAGRGGKQPGAGGIEPGKPPGAGGKQPAVYPVNTRGPTRPSQPQTPRQQPSPRLTVSPGIGGKQPAAYQQVLAEPEQQQQPQQKPKPKPKPKPKQPTSYQPASPQQPPSHRTAGGAAQRTSQSPARPARQVKQSPFVGKRVKVFYIDEGYHGGIVKSVNEATREFIIQWDDGSTSGVILNEDDETEESENDDRWSIVEEIPYEPPSNELQKARGGRTRLQAQPYEENDT